MLINFSAFTQSLNEVDKITSNEREMMYNNYFEILENYSDLISIEDLNKLKSTIKQNSFDQQIKVETDVLKVTNDLGYKIDSLLIESFDYNTNMMEDDTKEKWIWQENGNLIKFQRYEIFDGEWDPVYMFECEYNENNDILEYVNYYSEYGEDEWVPYRKRNFEYDLNNLLITTITKVWDTYSQDWANKYNETITYNENNLITQVEERVWSNMVNVWMSDSRHLYEYNDDNVLIRYENLSWNEETYEWVSIFLTYDEYDENGNIILSVEMILNNTSSASGNQTLMIYDENNLMLESSINHWNNVSESWDSYSKYFYTYNNSEDLILKSLHYYDADLDEYTIKYSIAYEYDTSNNLIFASYMNRNYQTHEWAPYQKYSYDYDAENRQIYQDHFIWQIESNQWTGDYIEEYEFDDDANLIFETRQEYDVDEEQWNYVYDYGHSYNKDILLSNTCYPDPELDNSSRLFELEESTHAMTSHEILRPHDGDLNPSKRYTMYYSYNSPVIINEAQMDEVLAYPNPTKDHVKFTIDNPTDELFVEVFDIQGRRIIAQQLSSNNKLTTTNLESGIYFYTIKYNNISKQGKFIKH
jgi:hypothetical protein